MGQDAASPALEAERAAATPAAPRRRGALAQDLDVVATMWLRDMMHLAKERSRWLGMVLQPLLFWLLLGSGMARNFKGPAGGSYLTYFFPGVLVMVLLFTSIFATITVIEDRKSGFLQGVLVAPGSRAALVLGKVLGVSTMIFVQVGLLVALSPLAGYPFASINWGALVAVIALSAVGLIGLTFTMAWVLESSQAYHAIMSIVLLPLWVVSGAMFPGTGSWVEHVVRFNPMGYCVQGARAALGGAGNLPLSLAVLGGFAAAMLALATWVTNRK